MALLKSKKALSPLIATILLLVFAVGLGIIVMSWGKARVEAGSTCPVILDLNFIELNNQPQFCYSGSGANGIVTFIVENGYGADISSLQLRIIGTKQIYTVELPGSGIKKGDSLMKTSPYNFDLFGDIRQVKVTPRAVLYPGESPLSCPEQALTIENIKPCK